MTVLDYARQRTQACLEEIARVAESEFPYKGSEEALKKLEELFRDRLKWLNSLSLKTKPDLIKQECAEALGELEDNLELLGFILRSTNVRNAFEVFRPVLRLARAILEPKVLTDPRQTQIVLSSEWAYSPFVYPELPQLPGFVLIGFPSPESGNPLIVPLAGHELGHSYWSKEQMGSSLEPNFRKEILAILKTRWKDCQAAFPSIKITKNQINTNTAAYETIWAPALSLTLMQGEETFCDFLGLRIFGTSYLESFAYLLAPNDLGERSLEYPDMLPRIGNLVRAAKEYGVPVRPGYEDQFDNYEPPDLSEEDEFRLEMADEALDKLVPGLIKEADRVVKEAGIESSTPQEIARIVSRVRLVVPAEGCKTLADILNAAWVAYLDNDLWRDVEQVRDKRDKVLKELILKNIELFEIEQILKESP